MHLGASEKEAIAKVKDWRNGTIAITDETLIDSTRHFLLLASRERLFLIEREGSWKGELDEWASKLYVVKGRRSLRRIYKHLKAMSRSEQRTAPNR